MRSKLLLIALIGTTTIFAGTHVLWQDDLESYDLGKWLGQGNTEVMQSTVNCEGEEPVEGEMDITNDGENWILHVGRKKTPAGVTAPKMDRGVKIPSIGGALITIMARTPR
ncbi:hypothetical protein IJS98_07120 [bacterium]|nr:hypothetical protein [bacterium]